MLSWRHFVVHDGVGHAAKLPRHGVKINEDGSHSSRTTVLLHSMKSGQLHAVLAIDGSAPLCFTFKSIHEHDELNWPTKSAIGFREAATEDAKICATPLWLTVSDKPSFHISM